MWHIQVHEVRQDASEGAERLILFNIFINSLIKESASLASLQVTATQEKWLICWRASLLGRGTIWEVSWKSGLTGISWSSTEMDAKSCAWDRNAPCPGTGVPSRHPGTWESWQTPHPTFVSNVAPAEMKANCLLGCSGEDWLFHSACTC